MHFSTQTSCGKHKQECCCCAAQTPCGSWFVRHRFQNSLHQCPKRAVTRYMVHFSMVSEPLVCVCVCDLGLWRWTQITPEVVIGERRVTLLHWLFVSVHASARNTNEASLSTAIVDGWSTDVVSALCLLSDWICFSFHLTYALSIPHSLSPVSNH